MMPAEMLPSMILPVMVLPVILMPVILLPVILYPYIAQLDAFALARDDRVVLVSTPILTVLYTAPAVARRLRTAG